MEELLQKLQSIHGLSAEQAQGVLGTIIGYIKEKFPMVEGAIDNFFPQSATQAAGASAATPGNATQGSGDFLDKISEMIPGGAGEKLEQLAKDKLGGLFGENKTA
ncbi:MAG TPA: hypothetical protein VFI29_13860 [Hanamia sp.]|nr:hypothetical protein [Hanamia sp.]